MNISPAVLRTLAFLSLAALPCAAAADDLPDLKPVPRVLPPEGRKISDDNRKTLEAELARLTAAMASLPAKGENASAEIFLKAVRYALELHEFYKAEDFAKARGLLVEADYRIQALHQGTAPWLQAKGLVVRGYYSSIDGSAQPFGLEIPEDVPPARAPAWMWLQGRGETKTDLHFIAERMKKRGQFQPAGTIIVHPFGRYCTGYKSAGGQDVLEVQELLIREKRIDPQRVALAGFSMGGAGAWLLGAHHPDRWRVVHSGAGFVDVRRYLKITDSQLGKIPAWEQTLWGLNDVPGYVRNLLNVPVIAYSGERDKQRAAAEIMAEAFQQQGAALTHFIGPGAEHAYEPETRLQIENEIQSLLLAPLPPPPLKLSFQTRSLSYASLHWLRVTGLDRHWQDTRVDAELTDPSALNTELTLKTLNVSSLQITHPRRQVFPPGFDIHIDGKDLKTSKSADSVILRKIGGVWSIIPDEKIEKLQKHPGLQGPIDDAFKSSFIYVLPDRDCADPLVNRWVKFESDYQQNYWRRLMRGDIPVKTASKVTSEDIRNHHLILWGDAISNELIKRVLPDLPLTWAPAGIRAGGNKFPAAGHIPVLIHPNPLNREKYIVINSGLTFRDNHCKTNSLQNPHLPDWAVLDLSKTPDGEFAGKVAAAGFFDENWDSQRKTELQSGSN